MYTSLKLEQLYESVCWCSKLKSANHLGYSIPDLFE